MIILCWVYKYQNQLYPQNLVPRSNTSKNHPIYDLLVPHPPPIISPIPRSAVAWL